MPADTPAEPADTEVSKPRRRRRWWKVLLIVVEDYDQVFMVLCGHIHTENRQVSTNAVGREVYEMLADGEGERGALRDGQQVVGARDQLERGAKEGDRDRHVTASRSPC